MSALASAPVTGNPGELGLGPGVHKVAGGEAGPVPSSSRRRLPCAQLLRRVLSVDALSCPRCSNREQTVPVVVLAFLSDPYVVGKILRHLGLPPMPPALAAARPSGWVLGFGLAEEGAGSGGGEDAGGGDCRASGIPTRPPPRDGPRVAAGFRHPETPLERDPPGTSDRVARGRFVAAVKNAGNLPGKATDSGR